MEIEMTTQQDQFPRYLIGTVLDDGSVVCLEGEASSGDDYDDIAYPARLMFDDRSAAEAVIAQLEADDREHGRPKVNRIVVEVSTHEGIPTTIDSDVGRLQ
jgi:hypothetical protein